MPSYCITCIVTEDNRDLASAIWYECGMLGCEEENAPEGLRVKAFFKTEAAMNCAAEALKDIADLSPIDKSLIEDQDWNAKWRESMQPAQLDKSFWVSPVWLPPVMNEGDHWIKIEPKMAFGTGHHETTRLAAQGLIAAENDIKGKSLIEIGTGSGVICFVADICGVKESLGIEIDPVCQDNLAENKRFNPIAGKIDFLIGTADSLRFTAPLFEVAVMNMILTESTPQLPFLTKILKKKALLIWSGILTDEKKNAIDAASEFGFILKHDRIENDWWCGTFEFA